MDALRKHADTFCHLLDVMTIKSDLPCFQAAFDLTAFKNRFMWNLTEKEVIIYHYFIIGFELD
jgi:phosphatidylinositol kinase/protein kinase (PI-3  family)